MLPKNGGGMQNVLVLIVEDAALIQLEIETALQEAGFNTDAAATGKAAIAKLEAVQEIRGLVTDVNLGNAISGWDVARRARQLAPDLPVVYATSVSMAEWSVNGVPNSVLIAKPYVPAQIITALSQLLNAVGAQPQATGAGGQSVLA
jgi:CheY-like chemotaxis protein